LIEVLDCTVTLRRGVDDRSTQVSVVVTSGCARTMSRKPTGNCWPVMCGASRTRRDGSPRRSPRCTESLFDLSETDVLDQADEISALILAIVARLYQDGDTVLALDTADWFAPFDSVALVSASLNLVDRAVSRLCDRLAYALGDHLRLVEADEAEPPPVEHPRHWWLARGWHHLGEEIVVRPCDS
jgi:hypothetical protein